MILLDTNIVIDLLEPAGRWAEWSREQLADVMGVQDLVTSVVVLAECARHFPSVDAQLTYLGAYQITVRELDAIAGFRAGQAHLAYRRAGGSRDAILADFLIGGHASALGATLLTRDRQRFASYFPDLTLITPETHPNG